MSLSKQLNKFEQQRYPGRNHDRKAIVQAISIVLGIAIAGIFFYSGILKLLKKQQAEKMRKQFNASPKLFTVLGSLDVFFAFNVLLTVFFSGAVDWLGFFGALGCIALMVAMFYHQIQANKNNKTLLLPLSIILLCVFFLISVAMR